MMDPSTIGVISICLTVMGCTWKLSAQINSTESTLLGVQKQGVETHEVLLNHVSPCDMDRTRLNLRTETLEKTTEKHSKLFDNLGKA